MEKRTIILAGVLVLVIMMAYGQQTGWAIIRLATCTSPQQVNAVSRQFAAEDIPQVEGRIVAWIDDPTQNAAGPRQVKIYDLGNDEIFNTQDDGGLIHVNSQNLHHHQVRIYGKEVMWLAGYGSIMFTDIESCTMPCSTVSTFYPFPPSGIGGGRITSFGFSDRFIIFSINPMLPGLTETWLYDRLQQAYTQMHPASPSMIDDAEIANNEMIAYNFVQAGTIGSRVYLYSIPHGYSTTFSNSIEGRPSLVKIGSDYLLTFEDMFLGIRSYRTNIGSFPAVQYEPSFSQANSYLGDTDYKKGGAWSLFYGKPMPPPYINQKLYVKKYNPATRQAVNYFIPSNNFAAAWTSGSIDKDNVVFIAFARATSPDIWISRCR